MCAACSPCLPQLLWWVEEESESFQEGRLQRERGAVRRSLPTGSLGGGGAGWWVVGRKSTPLQRSADRYGLSRGWGATIHPLIQYFLLPCELLPCIPCPAKSRSSDLLAIFKNSQLLFWSNDSWHFIFNAPLIIVIFEAKIIRIKTNPFDLRMFHFVARANWYCVGWALAKENREKLHNHNSEKTDGQKIHGNWSGMLDFLFLDERAVKNCTFSSVRNNWPFQPSLVLQQSVAKQKELLLSFKKCTPTFNWSPDTFLLGNLVLSQLTSNVWNVIHM